ncbi:hypothetical protein K466DRAFT_602488 [Polyporus arcularius HHB13444]|uniref:DUF6533 domain-containing protein n=1 Tax=Polyporus arcularius HHB13444 TaxID=1314778 RepID=A0A5C3PDC4_9APHY|nr:hypothetical protein K466DRAFT_602488 [Polyporus arcularius HHB13444]
MAFDAETAAAMAAVFNDTYTAHYCDTAVAALFLYDTLITLDREVAYFWNGRSTGAACLFLANKWISTTLYVLEMAGSVSSAFPSDKFVPWAAFSALRAYVLSRSKVIGLLILVLSLAPAGANLIPFGYHLSGYRLPPFGCRETNDADTAVYLRSESETVVMISRIPLTIADIMLIYITWKQLNGWDALMNVRQSKRLSLSDILFRGGTIYFIVLFIMNVLHLAFSVTEIAGSGEGGESLLPQFTGPITAVLMSRFLLELQEVNDVVVRVDLDDPLHSSRNPYDRPSFIASLGGFLDSGLPALESDDDSESHLGSLSDREAIRLDVEGSETATTSSLSA